MIISNWKAVDRGAWLATFSVEMPSGITLNECRYMDKDGRQWVNFPSRAYDKPDGSKGYADYIAIKDRAVKDKWQAKVVEAIKEAGVL